MKVLALIRVAQETIHDLKRRLGQMSEDSGIDYTSELVRKNNLFGEVIELGEYGLVADGSYIWSFDDTHIGKRASKTKPLYTKELKKPENLSLGEWYKLARDLCKILNGERK